MQFDKIKVNFPLSNIDHVHLSTKVSLPILSRVNSNFVSTTNDQFKNYLNLDRRAVNQSGKCNKQIWIINMKSAKLDIDILDQMTIVYL